MNGPSFAQPMTAPAPAPKAPLPRPAAARVVRPDPDAGNGLRVFTYLRLHWLMIAFCGTLLGAAGAYAAWELLPSKYESYALFQVSSVPSSLANQNNPSQARTDFATYVKTTAALIKSDFVLNAALRDLKDTPTIKEQPEPIKYLDEEVLVNWQDGSEVVRITFKGQNPGDVKKVVDSVQKAFLAEVVQKEVDERRRFLSRIESARDTMQQMLAARGRKPDAAKPGGILPVGGVGQPGPADPMAQVAPGPFPVAQNPPAGLAPPAAATTHLDRLIKFNPKALVERFAALHGDAERLPMEIEMGRSRLKEIEGKVNALKTAPLTQAALADADKESDVIAQSLQTKKAKLKYETYRSAGDEAAPGVLELKKAWEAHDARLQEVRLEKARQIEGHKRSEEMKKLAAEWETVKHQVERLEAQHGTARAGLDRLAKELDAMPGPADKVMQAGFSFDREKPYQTDTTDLITLDGIYARLVAQHQLVKLDLESPERVRLIQPASSPTQKDMRKQILGTVFAGLMGYVLLALGVVGYETLGRRVSSLSDLKSAGPAAIVGVIPYPPAEATGRDPVKRAAANEAIDKLRAYVAQTWLSRGVTTVAVTSPIGDEGKAFTAFGLASSLAQAGYKTLAVDFDLREPALHTYAGVPNQTGLCEVLRGETDPRAAVQTLPSGLDLLPAGKWSDEARKAAVGGRLEALLARLKEPYDCVILHGHALLTVAESVEVARRCEVVLVCARYRETKVPLLHKATDRLAAMEIPYSGVVYVGATEHEALC